MMLVVLWRNDHKVTHQEIVGIPLAFKELTVVLDIIDAWEDFLEVSKSKLFFLEV